jgi:hypothetical protein
MRKIIDAVSWQIQAGQILQTKGVKLENGLKWHRNSPVVN